MKEHYNALEDQILPVQLKYERNNILQEAVEEINAKQNKENVEEDYTENNDNLANTRDEYRFFLSRQAQRSQRN